MKTSFVSLAGLGLALAVVIFHGAGCSYDWTYTDPGPDPDGSGSGTGSAVAPDASADAGGAGPVPIEPIEKSDAGAVACDAKTPCDPDKYCKFGDGRCGQSGTGSCVARPTKCTPTAEGKVCACSGKIYESGCDAALAGDDLSKKAEDCAAPVNTYACGQYYCTKETEYCASMGGKPFQCYVYTQCAAPSCDCPEYSGKQCFCEGAAPKLVLTCP